MLHIAGGIVLAVIILKAWQAFTDWEPKQKVTFNPVAARQAADWHRAHGDIKAAEHIERRL